MFITNVLFCITELVLQILSLNDLLMFAKEGKTDKEKATTQIVLTKEPKVPSTAVKEMREDARKRCAWFFNKDAIIKSETV